MVKQKGTQRIRSFQKLTKARKNFLNTEQNWGVEQSREVNQGVLFRTHIQRLMIAS